MSEIIGTKMLLCFPHNSKECGTFITGNLFVTIILFQFKPAYRCRCKQHYVTLTTRPFVETGRKSPCLSRLCILTTRLKIIVSYLTVCEFMRQIIEYAYIKVRSYKNVKHWNNFYYVETCN